MRIKVLAASDRNNYGDLLFPLIIKKELERRAIPCSFENYGIIESDLSYFGALPTRSYSNLLNDLKENKSSTKIIVAGGEVLGGSWLNILRFVSSFWNKLNKNRFSNRIISRLNFLETYFYFFKRSSRPFILDHSFYSGIEIIYNSVGALSIVGLLKSDRRYKKYFQDIPHLSVRDWQSLSNFELFNIKPKLVPDSALLMSDLFSWELENLVGNKVKELENTDYAFVQLGYSKGPDDLDEFRKNLEAFSSKNNLRIILCPIGLAMDHNDQIILMKLAKMSDRFTYLEPTSIYDIMQLIKKSKIYMGTSLHGIITAQSFTVPSIAFTQKIKKLEYYIETWFDSPKDIISDYTDFKKVEDRLINFDSDFEKKNLSVQKGMVYDNLLTFFNEG